MEIPNPANIPQINIEKVDPGSTPVSKVDNDIEMLHLWKIVYRKAKGASVILQMHDYAKNKYKSLGFKYKWHLITKLNADDKSPEVVEVENSDSMDSEEE